MLGVVERDWMVAVMQALPVDRGRGMSKEMSRGRDGC